MIHRYTFIIKQQMISIWETNETYQEFEPLTDKGEKIFPLNEDTKVFWSWWENHASFVEGEDQVDFSFVYDAIPNEFISHPFKKVKESKWKKQNLEQLIRIALQGQFVSLENSRKGNKKATKNTLFFYIDAVKQIDKMKTVTVQVSSKEKTSIKGIADKVQDNSLSIQKEKTNDTIKNITENKVIDLNQKESVPKILKEGEIEKAQTMSPLARFFVDKMIAERNNL